jgi:nucleoside phosphorylase
VSRLAGLRRTGSRLRRAVLSVTIVALALGAFPPAATAARAPHCTSRLLVLSAFPAELGPLYGAAKLDRGPPVVVGGRSFFLGRLEGKDVVMAMTGIGPINARQATEAAFARFRCPSKPGISAVVFSGVAGGGGPSAIGDVTIPSRWTLDNGATWLPSDSAMVAAAARATRALKLERTTPLGDPACTCQNPDLVKTVRLKYVPKMVVGGDGATTDPFGGRAVPCAPSGGDLAGCQPCRATLRSSVPDAQRFTPGLLPLLDPAFLRGLAAPTASGKTYVANDEETAAVARVAAQHGTRFVGFRAISDGAGDPLGLPGFPFQFFVYKQLAADNAAAVTLAFLKAWRG